MSLKDQILTDLDSIFDTDGLAVPGLWTPDGKDPVTINGFFESALSLGTGQHTGQTKLNSSSSSFTCKSADVVGMKSRDSLIVEGRDYLVAVDPVNTHGFTQIILNEDY